MKINVFYYPFGEMIEVRKMTGMELALAKYSLSIQEFGRVANEIIDFMEDCHE